MLHLYKLYITIHFLFKSNKQKCWLSQHLFLPYTNTEEMLVGFKCHKCGDTLNLSCWMEMSAFTDLDCKLVSHQNIYHFNTLVFGIIHNVGYLTIFLNTSCPEFSGLFRSHSRGGFCVLGHRMQTLTSTVTGCSFVTAL